jgi:ABC-type transporter Mla subunit MlaD
MISQVEKDAQTLDTLLIFTQNYLSNNEENITSLIENSNIMFKELTTSARSINKLVLNTNNLIASGNIDEALKNIREITAKLNTEEFTQLIRSTDKLINSSQETVDHFDKTFLKGRSNLLKSVELFKEALENINEFAILLKDNPDILIKGKESE